MKDPDLSRRRGEGTLCWLNDYRLKLELVLTSKLRIAKNDVGLQQKLGQPD